VRKELRGSAPTLFSHLTPHNFFAEPQRHRTSSGHASAAILALGKRFNAPESMFAG
jgi:hypothetical protein